ncbi:hypothetical protein [Streptomyces sviceus]|uniref:hypothetical protein n=1 Tax=Streptomyces sviceus TaxID=285530 RepID=UPI003324D2CD
MKAALVRTKRKTAAAVVSLFLMVGGALGISLATAGPAAAADYGISVNQACKYTYNTPSTWADSINLADPFAWVCRMNTYTATLPPAVQVVSLGGVDMQKYCSITYPGSRAVIVSWNAYGWKCRR